MSEFEKMILRDFIDRYWNRFQSYCESCDASAQEIYESLGGEPE